MKPLRNLFRTRPFQGSVMLRRYAVVGALVLFTGLSAAAAPDTNPAAPLDFSSFKLITDRNIFNTARSPRRSGAQADADKPARVDTITLYGTFIYEKGPFAFFTGSSADYRQVLDVGKSIAGYTIAEINGRGVKLAAGTNTVELRVGMQLRREEGGDWQVVGDSGPAVGSVSSGAGKDDTSGSDESDIVKRMMKQREEELK
jgi:hypothetical protein